ncbi:hypothetical protein O181_044820 [Austropuccinia psidii MF-1]|uniref:Integrase catalytic domain-containing protein n=1 Tax=Austropuccinia psidii MF-1 TaxID=1389203 RepID=A0A9Q3HKJ5_9BASI|nr:hypothetical protein [Austropuccinia psidii MF-1]
MDRATAHPPSGDSSYNTYLVIVDKYSKTPIFLPCHKDDTAMDTALLLWSRVIPHTGLFNNIISDRDPKLTSALWANLHKFFGTELSFSTAYHPQENILSERMIQTLEDIIKGFCACGLVSQPWQFTSLDPHMAYQATVLLWPICHIHHWWPIWPHHHLMNHLWTFVFWGLHGPSPQSRTHSGNLCPNGYF